MTRHINIYILKSPNLSQHFRTKGIRFLARAYREHIPTRSSVSELMGLLEDGLFRRTNCRIDLEVKAQQQQTNNTDGKKPPCKRKKVFVSPSTHRRVNLDGLRAEFFARKLFFHWRRELNLDTYYAALTVKTGYHRPCRSLGEFFWALRPRTGRSAQEISGCCRCNVRRAVL
jgi:hypothetical protein